MNKKKRILICVLCAAVIFGGLSLLFLRKAGGEESQLAAAPGEKLPREFEEFAQELGISLPQGKALLFGQSLYWVPREMPQLQRLKVLRPGLELGEVKKDRFQPAHALALWSKELPQAVSFAADSNEIKAYLHGEALPCPVKGWHIVCVDGYSIGWGKGDGRVLKNHYPKGLRR